MDPKPTERILNLDDKSTWYPDFAGLVEEDGVWPRVEKAVETTFGSITEFCNQLTNSESSTKDKFVLCLRHRALNKHVEQYFSVMAYHGCRIGAGSSYDVEGILPSDVDALKGRARILFEGLPGLEEKIDDVCQDLYVSHIQGRVWLYFSGVHARNEDVHIQGSEFLRAVAKRLGDEAEKRFEKTGKPTLIQCVLPIEWLDGKASPSIKKQYACRVLSETVYMKYKPGDELGNFGGGFYITRTIPPPYVQSITDLTMS